MAGKQFEIEFHDSCSLRNIDPEAFRRDLKKVFDASIPWDNPIYDSKFQEHYFENAEALVIVRYGDAVAALSLAFKKNFENYSVLYIAGIWVAESFKSLGLGKLITNTLIECGFKSCFASAGDHKYIALRTQNPRVYEYLSDKFDVYPKLNTPPEKSIAEISSWVHSEYSKNKKYDPQKMIIKNVFPKGIVVGHLHPAKSHAINNFFYENLNIKEGDSYILVSRYMK